MTASDTKVVEFFPTSSEQHPVPEWRCREIGRDIAALQDLSQELKQMKAPLHQAFSGLAEVDMLGTHHDLRRGLMRLGSDVEDLGTGIAALVDAMTTHQGALQASSSLGS